MVGTEHRTHPEPSKKDIQDRTPRGAASWSIGPHHCRDCFFWRGGKANTMQDEQPCQKYRQIMGPRRKNEYKIYGGTLSCRYFEKRPETRPPMAPAPKEYSSADFGASADDETPF
jgi:hypothetical protein